MKYQYWKEESGEYIHFSDTIPESYVRLFELGVDGNYWEIFVP
jgi:hypothetical protein